MARLSLTDYLQNHTFWLMDIGPINARALPVLTPLYGFSSITAPALTAQVKTIKPGNHVHAVTVVTGAEEAPITLQRGAGLGDAEFYRWIKACISGNPANRSALAGFGTIVFVRRNLLLIQFLPRLPFTTGGTTLNSVGAGGGLLGGFLQSLIPAPFEGGLRLPARAWVLKGCLATKYKAGSTFNATDASVSVMELEVIPEEVSEVNLGV